MKRFCILLSLVVVLGAISGCSPAGTTTATSAQTSTSAPSETQTHSPTTSSTLSTTIIHGQPNFDVLTKTTLNKTSLITGENLTIQAEIEYVGGEAPFSGVPIIIIFDSAWMAVAKWCLDEQNNPYINKGTGKYFQIEKNKKYILNITWDLRNLYNNLYIPSGEYKMQITIAKPQEIGEYFFLSNGNLTIDIINNSPELTTTPPNSPTYQYNKVVANTNLSATSLHAGDNLTIQSEVQYVGENATITGVPTIMVLDSGDSVRHVVAHWSLDQNDNIHVETGPMQYFQIEKGRKYLMSVTWNLKNMFTNSSLPPGQYILWVTIAIPFKNGYSPLITNENLVITIS